MSHYYNIVPWYNSAEWHLVYDNLYSENSTILNKQDALKIFLIWKARCPSLPSGIESTLVLLQVYIEDLNNEPHDIIKEHILRLAYASAIMRFVNHMLDSESIKGASLYEAAKSLGIPDWVVDLRHDTAHSNNLPSLELLREAALIGLTWLQTYYWDKHKNLIKDFIVGDEGTTDESKIAVLMNFCVSLSICAHPDCKIRHLGEVPDKSMVNSIANDVAYLFGQNINMSNSKLVTIDSLINMVMKQAPHILKEKTASKEINASLLGKDSVFLSIDFLQYLVDSDFNQFDHLNKDTVQCFEFLLRFLHTHNFLLDFVLDLILKTQNEDLENNQRKLCALWVSEILRALKRTKDFLYHQNKKSLAPLHFNQDLKSLFEHWFPNEKGCKLILDLQKDVPEELTNIDFIQPIIATYNPYIKYFVKDLLMLLKKQMPYAVVAKICMLAQLIGDPDQFSTSLTGVTSIYTVDDIKKSYCEDTEPFCIDSDEECVEISNISITEEVVCDTIQQSDNIWKISSQFNNWSVTPIGQLPQLKIDT